MKGRTVGRKTRKYPEITFDGCQIKDIYAARQLVKAIATLEARMGIGVTRITLRNCFICPDITERQWQSLNRTATGALLNRIVRRYRAAERRS